jgi:AmiR/NasT family two-component response regulator
MQSDAASESVAWALDIADHRAVVHQATGMVSVQLHCSVEEALLRLRGRAFASGQSIDELAAAVVEGRATFRDI